MSSSKLKISIAAGLFGPVTYGFGLFLSDVFHPQYSHTRDYISELTATGSPVFLFATFTLMILMGLSMTLYSLGLFQIIGLDITGQVASLLLATAGIIYTSIAFFPCDPQCVNFSRIGLIHEFTSDTSLYIGGASLVFLALHALRNLTFRRYWSLLFGLVTASTVYFTVIYLHTDTGNLGGLYQRLAILPPFTIMAASAVYLYRSVFITKQINPTPTTRQSPWAAIIITSIISLSLAYATASNLI